MERGKNRHEQLESIKERLGNERREKKLSLFGQPLAN